MTPTAYNAKVPRTGRGRQTRPRLEGVETKAQRAFLVIDGRPGRYTFARPLSVNSAAENGAFFFWLR
jgi:hypothetical protein